MVYIATHKKFNAPIEMGYNTIQVGAEGKDSLGFFTDNTGDNISIKNMTYCELTGLYWIWKNTNDEYKGLVHYRRLFSNTLRDNILKENDIKKALRNHDLILPFKCHIEQTLIEQYCESSGYEKDLKLVRDIIRDKYPEYLYSFDKVLNGHKVYFYNMIIAKRDVFDRYCEWLFSILFELEKVVDLTDYTDYQKRIYGFIAERLLNVFFEHNKYRIFECGVINTEEKRNPTKRILMALKRKVLFKAQILLAR